MRQRRTLRRAGGARGELDIDGIIKLQLAGQFTQVFMMRRRTHFQDAVERNHAWGWVCVDFDHYFQLRQLFRCQPARQGARQFRRQRIHHANVIGCLETCRDNQRAAAHLVQRIFQFGKPIGGIYIHQHQPDLGSGELRDHPFGIIGRPDAHPIARLQPKRQKPGGESIHLRAQFRIGPANSLLAHDQPWPITPLGNGPVKIQTNGLTDQGLGALASYIAKGGAGHSCSPWALAHSWRGEGKFAIFAWPRRRLRLSCGQ